MEVHGSFMSRVMSLGTLLLTLLSVLIHLLIHLLLTVLFRFLKLGKLRGFGLSGCV